MTYAARITALPLPEAGFKTAMQVALEARGLVLAAATIAAAADTELTALRARVEELERALKQISIMDHGNPYARDCANAARAAITTSKATGATA